jgi:hypothetical protein
VGSGERGRRRAHKARDRILRGGIMLRNDEWYVALAKEAAAKGDTVEAENCCQHAEQYFRVMREQTR